MKKEKNNMTIFMCIGIAIGTAIGVATDNFATFMPVGLAVGVGIGSSIDAKNRKKNKNAPEIHNNEEDK